MSERGLLSDSALSRENELVTSYENAASGAKVALEETIKTALDPNSYATAPPNLYNVPTMIQNSIPSGNFVIQDDAFLIWEKVATQRGMVLWLPQRGADSLYRMGFVPAGTVSDQAVNNSLINGQTGAGLGVVRKLQYNQELAVPYNANVSGDQVDFSDTLQTFFSRTKLFSGIVSLDSKTVPIGNTALNGQITLSAISDTRDVAVNSTTGSYTTSDLMNSAILPGEAINQVSVMKGAASLLASDLPSRFSAPNQSLVTHRNGGMELVYANPTPLSVAIADIRSADWRDCVFTFTDAVWVSPWKTIVTEAFTGEAMTGATTPSGNAVFTNSVQTGPINETGYLKFQWSGSMGCLLATDGAVACGIIAYHYYASCSSTGAVSYEIVKEKRLAGNRSAVGASNMPAGTNHYVVDFDPSFHKTRGFQNVNGGKYVGTFLAWGPQISYQGAPAPAPASPLTFTVSNVQIYAEAPELYVEGELGPARVFRYENLSAGQQLNLRGFLNFQCVPSADASSIVKGAVKGAPTGANVNLYVLLSALFSGRTQFHRNWVYEDYLQFIKELKRMDLRELLLWAMRGEPQVQTSALASGFFDTLGHVLGTVGKVAQTGAGIASMFAGGQFGDAAGEFGFSQHAAGQFGTSGGQFGAAGQYGGGGALGGRRQREMSYM